VSVSGFEESNQLSLFDDEASEKSRTVDSVISSIRDKFGADAITRAALIGDDNIGRRVHHVTEEKSPEQLEGRD
jgi:hypothetical protein